MVVDVDDVDVVIVDVEVVVRMFSGSRMGRCGLVVVVEEVVTEEVVSFIAEIFKDSRGFGGGSKIHPAKSRIMIKFIMALICDY